MSRTIKKKKSDERIVNQVGDQLAQLIATARRLDGEGNYVDCEVVVKATMLVVNGHTAAEALALARAE